MGVVIKLRRAGRCSFALLLYSYLFVFRTFCPSRRHQLTHSDQIVRGSDNVRAQSRSSDSFVACLPKSTDRLHPAKYFLHFFPAALADLVTFAFQCSTIHRGMLLRSYMRRDLFVLQRRYKGLIVIALDNNPPSRAC